MGACHSCCGRAAEVGWRAVRVEGLLLEMSDDTEDKQRPDHLFKAGQSGNPQGRPKGSRSKLGEQFISDLYADWQLHGVKTLEKVREDKPEAYLKVVASILPKDVNLNVNILDEIQPDDIDRLREAIISERARRIAAGDREEAGGKPH